MFFACGGRPVYGVYHPPGPVRPGAPLLVHCHPLGLEQLTCYRAEVSCARAAAARGFPVFRYHSRGHGDSAGDFADVTLESLTEDALCAAGQGFQLSGAAGVVWLGARLGALVAAGALRHESRTQGLVLWEPVRRPMDYFHAMLRNVLFSQVVKRRSPNVTVESLLRRLEEEGQVDVHGYYLHRALFESSRQADLDRWLEGWSGPTLVAQVRLRPGLAPDLVGLVGGLERRGAKVTVIQLAEEPGWQFLANPAWEGRRLVDGTVEWLDALA